jgi:hypothetical protein
LQRRGDHQEQRRLESLSNYTFAAGSFPLTELSADITKRLPRYAFLAAPTNAGLCHRCGSARPERELSNRLVGTAGQQGLYETFPRHRRRINRPDLPFGSETPKLPLHRVDPGKIVRDVVVAAAFARHP